MTGKIRIVSDLHVGHKASVIESFSALRPLAQDVDWLIFNGDTLELKYGDLDSANYDAPTEKKRFEEEAAQWRCKVTLITGNHDPEISDIHSLSILDRQVFITHGDGLFRDIAPWSSNIDNLKNCSEQIHPLAIGKTDEELHAYLQLHKNASIQAHKLDQDYNPTLWGKLKIFLHQTWPPTTPFRILKAWKEMPDRAVSLANRFSLTPKFIVIGHTHNPGIWKRGDMTVINLGSYFPWPGTLCIDIENDVLAVHKVHKSKGQLRVGRRIAKYAIEAERPAELPSRMSKGA